LNYRILQAPVTAQAAYETIIRIIDDPHHKVLPPVHFERVLYYDKLGQVAVANGAHAVAADAFKKVFCFDRSQHLSQALKLLSR